MITAIYIKEIGWVKSNVRQPIESFGVNYRKGKVTYTREFVIAVTTD